MNKLLERSIKSLSIVANTSTGLAHPSDESRAKELFIALRDDGVPLDRAEVKFAALANGWPDKHASAIADLAAKIGEGGRVVVKFPQGWGKWIVEKLKSEETEG
jgi:hypothetical protein